MAPVTTDDLMRYFEKDLFARYVGIELMDVRDGWAKAQLSIQAHHRNGLRMVHGGVLFTLADLAFAAAANSRGRVAVAVNASISFMKANESPIIQAEAREVSCGATLATYSVQVTDGGGEVLAVFQGLAYRKKENTDRFETI
jgi:acyl-CoA thioesterase